MSTDSAISTPDGHKHHLSMTSRLVIDVEPLGPFGTADAIVATVHDALRGTGGDVGLTMGVFLALAVEAYSRGEERGALLALDHATYLAQAEIESLLLKADA